MQIYFLNQLLPTSHICKISNPLSVTFSNNYMVKLDNDIAVPNQNFAGDMLMICLTEEKN